MNKSITVSLVHISSGKHSEASGRQCVRLQYTDFTLIYSDDWLNDSIRANKSRSVNGMHL